MTTSSQQSREFTGRHLLAIMLGFFGVIIAVNVTMAVVAGTSWTGFVVQNSYVASQEFNEKAAEARAQAALGWISHLEIADGVIRYALDDEAGKPVHIESVSVNLRRPAYESEDAKVPLAALPGSNRFAADFAVRDGIWIVEVLAEAGLEHPYRDTRRIVVQNGRMK